MAKRIEEAYNRNFKNVFVCMRCNATIRANPKKVEAKEIFCRKCGSNNLRSKHGEKRAVSAATSAAPAAAGGAAPTTPSKAKK